MPFLKKKRLWRKASGKEAGYLVSPSEKHPSFDKSNPPQDIDGIVSSASSLASLDSTDDKGNHQSSRDSSLGNIYGSLESLEDPQIWDSKNQPVRLLSSIRRKSVGPAQIQLEMNEEKTAEKPQKSLEADDHHVDPIDEETAAHVQKVVASIMRRYDKLELSDDSDSSTVVSDNSDAEASSDDESDDDGKEVFDFHAHLNKICKREDGSDSESDGNESDTSEKAMKTAVRRAMKKIKRERSDEMVESEKGSETEEQSPKSDDDTSSEQDGDESESSSAENEKTSFEMTKDVDPEIQDLMDGGLVIDPKKGQKRYVKNNEGKINSVPDIVDNLSDDGEDFPEADMDDGKLASTLEHSSAGDLRWPYSNYYVKEINQDAFYSENCDALPSYRSTQASASYPGRKRNVMLGRVWWVEWWAREDTNTKMNGNNNSLPSL